MSDPMGKQHELEPVTASDKVMSKRHKMHRREIDGMKDDVKKLKKSQKYNLAHAKEHVKAYKDSQKQLAKIK